MSTNKVWRVKEFKSFDSLQLSEEKANLAPSRGEVLVRHHAASLNYRDLIIALGKYPFPATENVVPSSDGAGEVVEVGENVTRWKKGDRVSGVFNQKHIAGSLDPIIMGSGLGGAVDGCLQQFKVYHEDGLVRIPSHMSYEEAACLPCAAVTAYNGLYGQPSHQLKPGQWVLTQGTGGVSIFALQLAKAAGAQVVATTSSKEKEDILKRLGADVVINYKTTKDWGQVAKKATGGRGVDFVIEVGGPGTMAQTLQAIKLEGTIVIIGFLGKSDEPEPTVSSVLGAMATARAVLVGSRQLFEDMVLAMETSKLRPVVDKVFAFDQLKDAYQYQWDQKHVGKVVVKIQ